MSILSPIIGKDDFKRTAVMGGLAAISSMFSGYFPRQTTQFRPPPGGAVLTIEGPSVKNSYLRIQQLRCHRNNLVVTRRLELRKENQKVPNQW